MTKTQVKDYIFKTPTTTICYARNGQRLHDGPVEKIPEHLLKYYVVGEIINYVRDNTYLEIVEDEVF